MNFAAMTDDQLREHLRDLISKGTVSNWNPKYVIRSVVHYQGLDQIRSIGQKLTIDSQHPELGAFVERIEFQGWSRTSKKMEFVVSIDGKFYKARISIDAQGKFTTHPWKKIRKSEAGKFEDRYEI